MKYIKTLERIKSELNKKNVDYNKIYVFYDIIGKIIPNPGRGFRDVGCMIIGYEDDEEVAHIIKYGDWNFVRVATPEEIDKYNVLYQANKYNL